MNTGRNDPCPCGSGKRSTDCCQRQKIRAPQILDHGLAGVRHRPGPARSAELQSAAPEAAGADPREPIKRLVLDFGRQRLNETYTGYALALCAAAAACPELNLQRGRIEIWAAAMVYAIAQLNFLFSIETPNHLTADELCRWFGVRKTSAAQKAGRIREVLDLFHDDERFCAPHITRFFQFVEDGNGFLQRREDVPEAGETQRSLPLKAPAGRAQVSTPVPIRPVKEDPAPHPDGQMKLFED